MPIRILDNGATINVKINGVSNYVDKEFDTSIADTTLFIIENNGKSWPIPFADVEVPITANVEALAAFVENLKESGGSPLPVGASTEAKQDVGNASLASVVTNTADNATETTLAALLAKVIAAPSTEAKQDAANALLVLIEGKDFATQTTLAAVLAKIIAAPATEAKQDVGNASLAAIELGTPASLDQQDMVDSMPVVLAGNHSDIRVSIEAVNADLATNTELALKLDETVFDDKTGSKTEVAPASDTASSGLNGRLQRIAQRITSLIALLPGSIGQKAKAASLAVTLASDEDDINIQSSIAHDAADSGNPIKIGAKAINHGANPTEVADGDRTDNYSNRAGIPFVIGGHPNIISFEYKASTAQVDDAIIEVGANESIVVTAIDTTLSGATTPDVEVRIGFGTTTVPSDPADGASVDGMVLSHPGIKPGSGMVKGTGAGIIAMGASDEDLRITNSVPTDGELKVSGSYYTIAI